VGPFVTLGSNVSIASGCTLGHHAVIEDHCFLAAGCVVSGSVRVGAYSLIGSGAVIRDQLTSILPHSRLARVP
jgi:UDP-3-O-[3-hydroxymyristoyl] glucosamine N-acyltransferase